MWVLSILLSDRAATTIPPTNTSTRTTARPILALRVLITVLLARAQARAGEPRRGHRDTPAPGSARVSKRHRAPREQADRAADPPAGARAVVRGRGNSPGRPPGRDGRPASRSSRRAA